jgi:preprotein translocase subunit YajC
VLDWLISPAFAQSSAAGQSSSWLMTALPLVMLAFLYFVMIRPQSRRTKEHRAMVSAIAKGDEVVTSGGLAGRVNNVGESYITLEVSDNVSVKVLKSSVTTVLPKGALKTL